MDLNRLATEIRTDPVGLGYSGGTHQQAADLLNAPTFSVPCSRRINERDLLAEWGDPAHAEVFLQKLESLSESNPVIRRTLRWFTPDQEGIDAGHPTTRAMLDTLVGQAGITQAEVNRFKAMAMRSASRAEVLGIGPVTDGDVQAARERL
jgi:hypothetical protein